MQPTETDTGSLVRRAGARAAVGHLNHLHSAGELAATPRRTGAAVYQKSKVKQQISLARGIDTHTDHAAPESRGVRPTRAASALAPDPRARA